ncbi:MAG: YHS domain-containing protein [Elusimicrobia bacterium]|nr:YHS domain-containing protein [Elusimicrobiota bacterium]
MGGHGDEHSGAPTSATCPVCGSQLKIDERTPRATYGGKLHYFASEDHLREFMKDPDRFLTGKPGGSAEHGEHR